MKTSQYLDLLKAHYDLTSDYQIAKKAGLSTQSVSRYRLNKTSFDDLTAIRIAELLEIEPAKIMADMHALRAKDAETRAVWERLSKTLTSAAAAIFLGVFVSLATLPAPAVAAEGARVVCILC
jgi:transcriptional regulator with XRE-family HTH domain